VVDHSVAKLVGEGGGGGEDKECMYDFYWETLLVLFG
jgi:hypothetical protein